MATLSLYNLWPLDGIIFKNRDCEDQVLSSQRITTWCGVCALWVCQVSAQIANAISQVNDQSESDLYWPYLVMRTPGDTRGQGRACKYQVSNPPLISSSRFEKMIMIHGHQQFWLLTAFIQHFYNIWFSGFIKSCPSEVTIRDLITWNYRKNQKLPSDNKLIHWIISINHRGIVEGSYYQDWWFNCFLNSSERLQKCFFFSLFCSNITFESW